MMLVKEDLFSCCGGLAVRLYIFISRIECFRCRCISSPRTRVWEVNEQGRRCVDISGRRDVRRYPCQEEKRTQAGERELCALVAPYLSTATGDDEEKTTPCDDDGLRTGVMIVWWRCCSMMGGP